MYAFGINITCTYKNVRLVVNLLQTATLCYSFRMQHFISKQVSLHSFTRHSLTCELEVIPINYAFALLCTRNKIQKIQFNCNLLSIHKNLISQLLIVCGKCKDCFSVVCE